MIILMVCIHFLFNIRITRIKFVKFIIFWLLSELCFLPFLIISFVLIDVLNTSFVT